MNANNNLSDHNEAYRLLAALVSSGLNRYVSERRAERWIAANLRPAKQRLSIHAVKNHCDHYYRRAGSACYLSSWCYADCLRRCGYQVEGDSVYAKEITP